MVNKFRSKVFRNLILMRIITRSRGLIKEVVTLYLRFFSFRYLFESHCFTYSTGAVARLTGSQPRVVSWDQFPLASIDTRSPLHPEVTFAKLFPVGT